MNGMSTSTLWPSWSNLKTASLNIMESCIPKAVLPTRHNIPWLNKEIVHAIRKRNLYFRRARKSGNRDDQEKFKQLRNKVVAKLRPNILIQHV